MRGTYYITFIELGSKIDANEELFHDNEINLARNYKWNIHKVICDMTAMNYCNDGASSVSSFYGLNMEVIHKEPSRIGSEARQRVCEYVEIGSNIVRRFNVIDDFSAIVLQSRSVASFVI